MCGFYGVGGVIEKAVTHELDGTAIAQGGDPVSYTHLTLPTNSRV